MTVLRIEIESGQTPYLMKTEVLSIQAGAPCGLGCTFCRTPNHGQGHPDRVLSLATRLLASGAYTEVYLTSTGETGLSPIFTNIVDLCRLQGIDLSVLCATQASIVPGLKRVEISVNPGTVRTAPRAIAKAKRLRIPFVISMVDDETYKINPGVAANEFGADGVLVRALQPEGRSTRSAGKTEVYQRPGSNLGKFPSRCYAELAGIGYASDCIDHNGNLVPLLGSVTV